MYSHPIHSRYASSTTEGERKYRLDYHIYQLALSPDLHIASEEFATTCKSQHVESETGRMRWALWLSFLRLPFLLQPFSSERQSISSRYWYIFSGPENYTDSARGSK